MAIIHIYFQKNTLFHFFSVILPPHSAKSARHIGKTKRYARLVNGNVRNFY